MLLLRSKLTVAVLGAVMCVAAAPAQANPAASAASGVIDASKIAADTQDGDAQFEQLFARWESLDKSASIPTMTGISIPSRMPLEGAHLSSDYGMRTHPVLGGRRNHKGVDLAAASGTPIFATADGYVSKAEAFSTYGNFVALEHGAEVQTRYAHMSRIAVNPGQHVQKGDIIGYVGSTGRSTGPHLHYEVRISGAAVNPVPYMVESQAQQAFALAVARGGQGDGDDN